MIKRTIEISSAGTHVKMRHNCLVITNNGEEKGVIPFEDLGMLIFDSDGASCTQAALVGAATSGAAVLFCGPNHHPAGLLLPIAGNQLHTERVRAQAIVKKPVHKRLWQQVISSKLTMQAAQLKSGSPEKKRLEVLSQTVKSGDTENSEGQGARIYWKALFGNNFRRLREGSPPNNFLNYGYMVLRAAVARAICTSGLHPALGIHHHHRNNPFCLADDLMEPYRPYVDARVITLWKEKKKEMDKECKRYLLELLTDTIKLQDETGPLMVALQKTTGSLVRCYLNGEQKLNLPKP